MQLTEKQKQALEESNKKSHERLCEDIRQALLILMEKTDYDKIRKTDIIKKANVSRSAFYRNYYLKKDILIDIIKRTTEDFEQHDTSDIYQNWEYIFRHIEAHAHLYKLLEKNGLMGFILDELNKQDVSEEDRFMHLLWNGMIYNICLEWVKNGMGKSVEEMMDRIKKALESIANKIYFK